MKQLKFSQYTDTFEFNRILTRLQLPGGVKVPRPWDMMLLLLPLSAFILWFISLRYVDVGHMNDLGLVSVLPPTIILALIVLTISFCLTLRQPQGRVPIILLHLFKLRHDLI